MSSEEPTSIHLKYRTRKLVVFTVFATLLVVALLLNLWNFVLNQTNIPELTIQYSKLTKDKQVGNVVSIENTNEVQHIQGRDLTALLVDEDYHRYFESTIKSCLSSYCYSDNVVYEDKSTINRIGILSPTNIGETTILQMILDTPVGNDKHYEFIVDSHVPAYGYGKNHGWSKIIRVVRSILPHAYSLLLRKYAVEHISTDLFDRQVRQLMRWHCRLSHVAAHTAMLSGLYFAILFCIFWGLFWCH